MYPLTAVYTRFFLQTDCVYCSVLVQVLSGFAFFALTHVDKWPVFHTLYLVVMVAMPSSFRVSSVSDPFIIYVEKLCTKNSRLGKKYLTNSVDIAHQLLAKKEEREQVTPDPPTWRQCVSPIREILSSHCLYCPVGPLNNLLFVLGAWWLLLLKPTVPDTVFFFSYCMCLLVHFLLFPRHRSPQAVNIAERAAVALGLYSESCDPRRGYWYARPGERARKRCLSGH
ncbi:hypothetical protein B0I72DRAFT_1373 [Yarrowia lipolytica]|uniref:Uncharacterized protein n=1 Tax=Yarrowia lipolytica TaxID=4952 RepID=A0A371BYL1_YARLL|nr:hypothetical protein B0I71DRAFT_15456 [Yarrowia lipolytica]RDW35082.1 hypothetical protein B0I72DRAFT_1373 [Yarrowia lipolytica]RDW44330.1 hypothetical protein B0I74DRAFT_47483 [Yarrowia lipolytica]RDW51145.1 hypothetical protein B0I75DRAFT_45464 [Yarrowia lipolytica]